MSKSYGFCEDCGWAGTDEQLECDAHHNAACPNCGSTSLHEDGSAGESWHVWVCPYCDSIQDDDGPAPVCCGELHSKRVQRVRIFRNIDGWGGQVNGRTIFTGKPASEAYDWYIETRPRPPDHDGEFSPLSHNIEDRIARGLVAGDKVRDIAADIIERRRARGLA